MPNRLLFAALASILAAPMAQAAPVSVPIEVHDGHVYVQVGLAGAPPLWFLVDSGAAAPVNLIAKATADRLQLSGTGEQQAGAIGGSVKLSFTAPLALRLGAVELPAEKLAIIPLGDGAAQEGHAVDGLLGYAFFRAFNPEIDYAAQRMRLDASPPAPRGEGVPLRIVDKNCIIDAELVLGPGQPPTPVKLVIDTGYDGGLLLTTPFVARHGMLKAAGAASTGAGVGGATSHRTYAVSRLSIGRLSQRKVAAVLSTDQDGAFASADVDGYIGGDLLSHYDVSFDYAHGRFTLSLPAVRR